MRIGHACFTVLTLLTATVADQPCQAGDYSGPVSAKTTAAVCPTVEGIDYLISVINPATNHGDNTVINNGLWVAQSRYGCGLYPPGTRAAQVAIKRIAKPQGFVSEII